MSLTKRYIDELIEEGRICQYCLKEDEHDREECGEARAREEDGLYEYTNR